MPRFPSMTQAAKSSGLDVRWTSKFRRASAPLRNAQHVVERHQAIRKNDVLACRSAVAARVVGGVELGSGARRERLASGAEGGELLPGQARRVDAPVYEREASATPASARCVLGKLDDALAAASERQHAPQRPAARVHVANPSVEEALFFVAEVERFGDGDATEINHGVNPINHGVNPINHILSLFNHSSW